MSRRRGGLMSRRNGGLINAGLELRKG